MKLWVKEKEKMAYKDNHSLHLYDVGIFENVKLFL